MQAFFIENNQNTILCAGIIPISYVDRKVLLIKHPNGHWGFPKGQIEFEETEITAAKRELLEETGISLNFLLDTEKYKYTITYLYQENGELFRKNIVFFLGITCTTEVNLNSQFKEYKWIDSDDIPDLELFDQYKQLLIKISNLIKKDIILKDADKLNTDNLNSYSEISSKHAYSRIAPLLLLHENIRVINQPNILDTYFINELINAEKEENSDYFIVNENDMSKCWSIINLLPALIFKHKKVLMKGRPNGCQIGKRPIELYIMIMESFGITVNKLIDSYYFEYHELSQDILIHLPFPSFSGTSIACYLALLSNHETCITNVSIEPEIIFLINTIHEIGYNVKFDKDNRILKIIGNPIINSRDISIRIPEDRNILVTKLIARMLSKQKMQFVANYKLDFEQFFNFLKELGINYYISDNYIIINGYEDYYCDTMEIITGFYPNICSDWHPIIALLLLKYCKKFKIVDEVFENRFKYINQLSNFLGGFNFKYDSNSLEVNISDQIYLKESRTIDFECLDIRASAALYLALNTWNVPNFTIRNLDQFFRGYSSISDFSREFEMRCKYVFDEE